MWTFLEHMLLIILLFTSLHSPRDSVGPLPKGGNSRPLLSRWSYNVGCLGHLQCVVIGQGRENQDVSTKDSSDKTELGIHLRRDRSFQRHEEMCANNSPLLFKMLLLI